MYVTGFEVTRQVACYARRLMFRNIKFVYSKCNISKALSYMLEIYAMNVTRFVKRVLYTHSFNIHFLSPSYSYINGPTAHVFDTTEG